MALRKCPICELNYLRGDEKLCHICQKAKKHVEESWEPIMCTECGEQPAVEGGELCADCLMEQERQAGLEDLADEVRAREMDEPLDDAMLGQNEQN